MLGVRVFQPSGQFTEPAGFLLYSKLIAQYKPPCTIAGPFPNSPSNDLGWYIHCTSMSLPCSSFCSCKNQPCPGQNQDTHVTGQIYPKHFSQCKVFLYHVHQRFSLIPVFEEGISISNQLVRDNFQVQRPAATGQMTRQVQGQARRPFGLGPNWRGPRQRCLQWCTCGNILKRSSPGKVRALSEVSWQSFWEEATAEASSSFFWRNFKVS